MSSFREWLDGFLPPYSPVPHSPPCKHLPAPCPTPAANPMPTMPEEQAASFGDATSFLGGAASSSYSSYAAEAPPGGAPGGGGEQGGGTGGSLSPVGRQESFTAGTGRTGGTGGLSAALSSLVADCFGPPERRLYIRCLLPPHAPHAPQIRCGRTTRCARTAAWRSAPPRTATIPTEAPRGAAAACGARLRRQEGRARRGPGAAPACALWPACLVFGTA